VISAQPGHLCRVIVVAAGTAALFFYDRSDTNQTASDTVIGIVPANAVAGSVFYGLPAQIGILCNGGANTPAVSIGYL
jgi:hypothetical protein